MSDEHLFDTSNSVFDELDAKPPTELGTHVFSKHPDSRQSYNINFPVSRFRPRYCALKEDEKELHDDLKAKAMELELLYNKVKDGRYKSLAFTCLEESIMWIIKELTS